VQVAERASERIENMSMSIESRKTLPLLAMCFALLTSPVEAQIYSTVKDASFLLTALTQTSSGRVAAVRITNKDILAALNASGAFHFQPGAVLLLRSVNGGLPTFVVREVNPVSTVDISGSLTLVEPGDAVHSLQSAVNWGIWEYTLKPGGGVDFDTWGLTTLYTGAIPTGAGGDLLRTVRLNSSVSGPGHVNGASSQCYGNVYANHARVD